ncbi:MAG: hypothetical protein R3345_08585 [Fulvivirga sp.]|nr:hypothetical protein [Fulvivirga sp.]
MSIAAISRKRSISNDFLVTLLFGILSAVLGLIKLDTPGFEGSYSDLREIALLICLFHLANPIFIIPLCLLTLLGLEVDIRLIPVFLLHVVPLFITWHIYQWIEKKQITTLNLGISWFAITLVYYTFLLYPALIITYRLFGINRDIGFIDSYYSLFTSGTLEMISTALVTSLYLVQLTYRRSLEKANKNLELIVKKRTRELIETNEELKSLNENLEEKVEERTKKIESQLNQMIKYAHMNAHEVRAPLARILGLLELTKKETDPKLKEELLVKLEKNSVELDTIIKKMNRLLEKEI